jgi:uncharacterized repeat protein (TIGR02543 family)
MAVVGNTIYIAYVFTENSSAIYPGVPYGPSVPALDVQVIASTNGGSTWSTPVVLPAMNATAGYWANSPSIAINSTGTVGVAYATNRSCVLYCYYLPGAYYADQIVFSTSTNNGTSWSAPTVVGNLTGETRYYQYYYDRYTFAYTQPWMNTPQTAVKYGGTGQSIYVAFAGTYVKSTVYSYYNYQTSGVFASYSANAGATWTQSRVQATSSTVNYDHVYSPGIAVSGGTAYIAYVWENTSYCPSLPCSPFVSGYSSWLAASTNGVNWTSTFSAIARMPGYYYSQAGWQGWQSTVTIGAGAKPVTATTLPGAYSFGSAGTNGTIPIYAETWYANVSIGYQYAGPTTNVLFVEHNLTAGSTWGISVDGYVSRGNGTAINVSLVPIGVGVLLAVLSQSAAYRTAETSTISVPSYYAFSAPKTVDVNYSIQYGVSFSIEPSSAPYVEVYISYGTQFYYVEAFSGRSYGYPAQPWYFPGGVTLEFFGTGEPPVTYWNGTGPGSYTGGGIDINLTLTAPVNETAWGGSYGVYTEGFYANGLPSTSVYSFAFNGANYSSSATSWTNVSNVGTGGYSVSHITANSSTAGWEYFGWIPGGSNVVVVPAQPTVGFDFAFVDVAAPSGTVTFHALGIGSGTVWSVQFNGTYYSSSTPWLNVSTRTGTFPWAVGAAVAANASVGYAPVGTGGSVSVTTGSTVNISYTSAYRVDVVAGLGGSVSGAGNHWLAHGAMTTYMAVASNGYTFGGWTGTGTGSYTGSSVNATVTVGGALTETASFYPLPSDRFNATFQQSTIPSGTWWTVYLNGVGYSSNTPTLTVSNLLSCAAGTAGQYRESVPAAYDNSSGATRYVTAIAPPPVFCTSGGYLQTLTFAPEYQVSVSATPGGSAYLANANVQSNTSLWAAPTDTVQLTAIHAVGYSFGGWNGTGSGSYTGGSISSPISAGGPVVEFATFVPLPPPPNPKYTETFVSSVSFGAGTSWSVKVQSTSYAGVGTKVVVPNLVPATYTVTVSVATASDGLSRWAPATATFPIHVTANGSQTVAFGKPSYWVTIGGSAGGTERPSSGWYATGTQLDLNATPDLGQTFVAWQGTGNGNYSGNLSATTLQVAGPVTEFATFQPTVQAAAVVTSFWSSTTTWAILGLVGLLVGLIVGIAVRRFRTAPSNGSGRPRTTTTTEPMRPWSSETASEGSGGSPSGGTP